VRVKEKKGNALAARVHPPGVARPTLRFRCAATRGAWRTSPSGAIRMSPDAAFSRLAREGDIRPLVRRELPYFGGVGNNA
jgi:hypothetical protein